MISVAVVSASGVLRAGLESLLQQSEQLSVVACESSVDDVLVTGRPLDVVLVDLDHDGAEGLTEVFRHALVVLSDTPDLFGTHYVANGRNGLAVLSRRATGEQIRAAVVAVASGLIVFETPQRGAIGSLLASAVPPLDIEPDPITPRETEVLTMLSEGLGNKMIARRLGISEHTVKFHVGSIMRKLNAGSRTEAVTTGLRLGILSV